MKRTSLAFLLLLSACSNGDANKVQGYVEGEYLNVGPQVTGRIVEIAVMEGAWVEKGMVLFGLDSVQAVAQRTQAEAAYAAATLEYERQKNLRGKKVASESAYDEAERRYLSAKAALDEAIWQVEERTVEAPEAGRVDDVYFRPGEVVTAGRPVLSLLPPANKKLRFFVPEARLSRVPIGAEVDVTCDGCPPDLKARVIFVGNEAEFTPPVIFSQKARQKLVYKIEATPLAGADMLKVGQPVDVFLPQP